MADFYNFALRLLRLTAIDLATLRQAKQLDPEDHDHRHFILAHFAETRVGRSVPLEPAADTFDFGVDPAEWQFEYLFDRAVLPDLSLQLWCDRGNDGALLLWELSGELDPAHFIALDFVAESFSTDGGPKLHVEARTLPFMASDEARVLVARSAPRAPDVMNTVAGTWTVMVRITGVKNLHRPVFNDDDDSYQHAEAVDGYLSHDDRGRIYTNTDAAGAWRRDYQAIGLSVEVSSANGPIPAGAMVRWSVVVVNDSSDDDENVHREAGMIFDPTCYDAHGNPLGARTTSLEGVPGRNPAWEAADGFNVVIEGTNALTNLVGSEMSATSHVILHCPDVCGDAFRVTATLHTAANPAPAVLWSRTGTMTMWKRVRVQYLRMNGAFPLPVRGIANYFMSAFTQLDFADEEVLLGPNDRAHIHPGVAGYPAALDAFITAVFTRRVEAGWFCLIAAQRPYPVNDVGSQVAFNGNGQVDDTGEYVRFVKPVDWDASRDGEIGSVGLEWNDALCRANYTVTAVRHEPFDGVAYILLTLQAEDVTPGFTGADADGSVTHAYGTKRLYRMFQRQMPGGVWQPGGYSDAATDVRVKVFRKAASYAAGVSPFATAGDGRRAFAGRTVVYTHHKTYANFDGNAYTAKDDFEARVRGTIVHELGHAFGMPHKCGYWDWKTPRLTSCTMNYGHHGLLEPDGRLRAEFSRKMGASLCGRHHKEIRRVHLEDNIGLGWPP
jgi:hypothetical protein